ncbi:hypothetical protein SAMN05444008_105118 [Cnuella takakiae]|uniref:SpoIIAA-like n=2 Tax=Cnuella takakiae TaxID=1302690 RepID=A0A1M4Z7M9_9BACT|nr:hypothetical protein BUE76_22245 [Cnuella takakiae]SHF14005.1 hypothetical protein SAMN05444008_105118 [Cnuella takakiae]
MQLEERKRKTNHFFFSESFVTIENSEFRNCLYVNWIGYQTESSVMTGCEQMLKALQFYNLTKVLNDNTNVLGIWTPAAKWVGENWMPRMEGAGLRQFAWVYSPSRMSQTSTDVAILATPIPQIIKTFYSLEEAKQWLQTEQ